MALDFQVCEGGKASKPIESVAMNPDEHWTLHTLALKHQLHFFSLIKDYYADYDIPYPELAEFSDECHRLKALEPKLADILDSLCKLAETGRGAIRPINVIAD